MDKKVIIIIVITLFFVLKKIRKINIKVGELTDLLPACIEYYFNIVSKDTIAENTKINVEKIPVEIKVDIVEF